MTERHIKVFIGSWNGSLWIFSEFSWKSLKRCCFPDPAYDAHQELNDSQVKWLELQTVSTGDKLLYDANPKQGRRFRIQSVSSVSGMMIKIRSSTIHTSSSLIWGENVPFEKVIAGRLFCNICKRLSAVCVHWAADMESVNVMQCVDQPSVTSHRTIISRCQSSLHRRNCSSYCGTVDLPGTGNRLHCMFLVIGHCNALHYNCSTAHTAVGRWKIWE